MRDALASTHARLTAGQPIRILVGDRLYDCAEIVLLPATTERLRKILSADLARQIDALTPHGEPVEPEPIEPPLSPAAPAGAVAQPLERTA